VKVRDKQFDSISKEGTRINSQVAAKNPQEAAWREAPLAAYLPP
jgi:hypothetical protein